MATNSNSAPVIHQQKKAKDESATYTKSLESIARNVSAIKTKDRGVVTPKKDTSTKVFNKLNDTLKTFSGKKSSKISEDKKPVSNYLFKYLKKASKFIGSKTVSFFKNAKDELSKVFSRASEGLTELGSGFIRGFLGPLNLILDPLKQVFGKDFGKRVLGLLTLPLKKIKNVFLSLNKKIIGKLKDIGSGLWKKITSPFTKLKENKQGKAKKDFTEKGKVIKPKKSDILKSNPEIAWLADELTGKSSEKKSSKLGGLSGLLEGAGLAGILKSVPPMLMKAGAIAALAGGIIWSVVDGIKGYAKSADWGTSKISSVIGGVFGSTESGFKGAFSNAGKFALLGAGIGFKAGGGPVGAIAGGLIGAAVGGILGYIGGANIAKGFDALGKKIKDVAMSSELFGEKVDDIASALIDGLFNGISTMVGTIPEMIVKAVTGSDEKAKAVGTITKQVTDMLLRLSPIGLLQDSFDAIKSISETWIHKGSVKQKIQKTLSAITMAPFNSLMKNPMFQKLNFMESALETKIKNAISNGLANAKVGAINIKNSVSVAVDTIMQKALEFIQSLPSKGLKLASKVTDFVGSIFTKLGEGVTDFFKENSIVTMLNDNILKPMMDTLDMVKNFFGYVKSRGIGLIKDLASGGLEKGFQTYLDTISAESSKDSNKKPIKVNDAIVQPSGRVITPSKDDTIIATKSKVNQIPKDDHFDSQEIQTILNDISKKADNTSNFDRVIDRLNVLIETVAKKQINSIIQPIANSGPDFDKLREVR